MESYVRFFFFFQAEDGIRDYKVTGVQTCALPILGQDEQKRVDGLRCAKHGQSFDGPKTRLQIRITRITQQRGQYRGRLDAAIAESAESPERKITAVGVVMNLIDRKSVV